MSSADKIKAGDLLYAVGPGHHAPHSAEDLHVYSAPVKHVDQLNIELHADRPPLGFPKWIYRRYEVGINVHLSSVDALRAFEAQSRQLRDTADRARVHANIEVEWAKAQINAACTPPAQRCTICNGTQGPLTTYSNKHTLCFNCGYKWTAT